MLKFTESFEELTPDKLFCSKGFMCFKKFVKSTVTLAHEHRCKNNNHAISLLQLNCFKKMIFL